MAAAPNPAYKSHKRSWPGKPSATGQNITLPFPVRLFETIFPFRQAARQAR